MPALPPGLVSYVLDPLERSARTFVQQFVIVILATGTAGVLVHQNWLIAADSAAFAAAISILTSVLTFKVPVLPAWADLLARVVKTGFQSFIATLLTTNILSAYHADWKGAIAVALPVAMTALLTGLAALGITTTFGASLLPAGVGLAQPAVPGENDPDDPDDHAAAPFSAFDPHAEIVPLTPAEAVPPFVGPGPNVDPS